MATTQGNAAQGETYTIKDTEDANFRVGKTPDGAQVIMGIPGRPYAAAVFFDPTGKVQRVETRPDQTASPTVSRRIPQALLNELWQTVDMWISDIGLVHCPINISQFEIVNLGIGIYSLPKFLREFLEDPSAEEDDDRQANYEEIEQWHAASRFALCWGTEYWMNAVGDVTDT